MSFSQAGCSSKTGSPCDLTVNQKRWLVIGICLHTIVSPILRQYIESEITKLYNSLVASNHINSQLYNGYLQRFPPGGTGYYLNYEMINNNKASYQRQTKLFNYRVNNAVDFSKLFLQSNIAQYTAFDESCDSSALLGIIINVNSFPTNVQNYAINIRSDIRNPWAHCNFTQWDAGKYANSIHLMVSLVKNLGLPTSEENKKTGDLHRWEATGPNFLSGTTTELEFVTDIRCKTILLSKHIREMANHSSETDIHIKEVSKVNKALNDTLDIIDGNMLNLEREVKAVQKNTESNGVRIDSIGEKCKALHMLQSAEEELYDRIMQLEKENRYFKSEIYRRDEEFIPENIKVDKYKALQSAKEELQERIMQLQQENRDLKARKHRQVDEPIPENIKAQHNEYIKEWEEDRKMFVVTRATQHVLESLKLRNCVGVTGNSGSGKSSIIHFVALQLKERDGYEIIPFVTGPSDVLHYANPKKNQVFVIDDICGNESINIRTVNLWKDHNERLERIIRTHDGKSEANQLMTNGFYRTILLFSCRNHIYTNVHFQSVQVLTKFECNLLSYKLCLLPTEKKQMIKKYIPDHMTDSMENFTDCSDLFPLLCQLAASINRPKLEQLFSSPIDYIKSDIEKLILSKKDMKSCAIVLCILFDNSFNVNWLKKKSENCGVEKIICDIVKVFSISSTTYLECYTLKNAFRLLEGTYLKKRGTRYRIIHDKIYEITAVICGNRFKDIFIKYSSSPFIRDYYIFESISATPAYCYIKLSKDNEETYFDRLINDLKNQDIQSTLHNKQLQYSLFRSKLIDHLWRNIHEEHRSFSTKLLQRFKPNTRDVKYLLRYIDKCGIIYKGNSIETTPLVEAAAEGFFDIAKFLIEIKCSVNNADRLGRSPLYKASEKGHINVVKLLLKNKAYIEQRNTNGESSLFVACKNGHIDVVKLLLVNKANIIDRTYKGWNPLHAAVSEGHTELVKMILTKYQTCVNECAISGPSLFQLAYKGGYSDIVKLLPLL